MGLLQAGRKPSVTRGAGGGRERQHHSPVPGAPQPGAEHDPGDTARGPCLEELGLGMRRPGAACQAVRSVLGGG